MKQSILFILAFVTSVMPMRAENGTCGESLTWDLTDGTLTISGTGAMDDYSSAYGKPVAPWFDSRESITSAVIEEGVTTIGSWAFWQCDQLSSVSFPSTLTTIGEAAFIGAKALESVVIPNNVTDVGGNAFSNCFGLKSVTINGQITEIKERTFQLCTSLSSIVIPDGVTIIGRQAFSEDSVLTNVHIGSGVTKIGESAFAHCLKLDSVHLHAGVTEVVEYAFYDCKGLRSITVAEDNPSYVSIDGVVFTKDSTTLLKYPSSKELTEYTVPSTADTIAPRAFEKNVYMKSIIIPSNVKRLGRNAFWSSQSLENVSLSESMAVIEPYTFSFCLALQTFTIPANITKIDEDAFNQCYNLTRVTLKSTTPPVVDDFAFYMCHELETFFVPCNTLEAYQEAWPNEYARDVRYPLLGEEGYAFSVDVNILAAGSVTIPTICEEPVITAVPNEGYRFVNWSDGETENPRTINLTEDLTLTANFVDESQEGIENVQRDKVQGTKVLRDGQLYLMYKGTVYNVQGIQVNE